MVRTRIPVLPSAVDPLGTDILNLAHLFVGRVSEDQKFSARRLNGDPETQTLGSCLFPVSSAAVTYSGSTPTSEQLHCRWLLAENL